MSRNVLVKREEKGVSKKEFEKTYVELADKVRIIEQKLTTKADDIVLTLTLAHRQEIEELHNDVLSLHEELKKVKKTTAQLQTLPFQENTKKSGLFKNIFHRLQFARK